MKVMVRERQMGKTTDALQWVTAGERTSGYPGWTRVLVVATLQLELMMRTWVHPSGETWWGHIEDWSHRVYDQQTWANRYGNSFDTAVVIDELMLCLRNCDWAVPQILRRDRVVGFTVSGESW